jgi:hypothetical protein
MWLRDTKFVVLCQSETKKCKSPQKSKQMSNYKQILQIPEIQIRLLHVRAHLVSQMWLMK